MDTNKLNEEIKTPTRSGAQLVSFESSNKGSLKGKGSSKDRYNTGKIS